MNILLVGMYGHMGQQVVKLAKASLRGASVIMGVDPGAAEGDPLCVKTFDALTKAADVDCIVDFSHHSAAGALVDFAVKHQKPLIVATTGHTPEEAAMIRTAGEKIPVFFSANMSLGIALLVELAKKTAAAMPDA